MNFRLIFFDKFYNFTLKFLKIIFYGNIKILSVKFF